MLGQNGFRRFIEGRFKGVHDPLAVGLSQRDDAASDRNLIGQPSVQKGLQRSPRERLESLRYRSQPVALLRRLPANQRTDRRKNQVGQPRREAQPIVG